MMMDNLRKDLDTLMVALNTIIRLESELSAKDDIIQILNSHIDDMIEKENNPVVLCTACQKEVNKQMDELAEGRRMGLDPEEFEK